jgi:esterase/lipase
MIQPQRPFSKLKTIVSFLILLALGMALGVALGPQNSMGPALPTPRAALAKDPLALEAWLKDSETRVAHLRAGTEKEIVWASAQHTRTAWSVVYIHGFSATKLETAPLTSELATALHANVFYTRLSGHGQASADLGQARVQDWMADVNEAVAIGHQLGDRVLVISCSTGSTLATWFGMSEHANDVAAHVFISPNFGPKDKRAEMINWPWGQQIAFAIQGPTRGQLSADPRQNQAWTTVYPTQALFPMMALTRKVRDSDLSQFQQPVLVFYSQKDHVVDPVLIQQAFKALGSKTKELFEVVDSESENQHVLVGDIYAPLSVEPMVEHIERWIQKLPPAL